MITPIQLNPDQIVAMGTPNFSCAPIAKLLIGAGIYAEPLERKKAEYEQAVFVHWALKLYDEHGSEWTTVADKFLADLKNEADT